MSEAQKDPEVAVDLFFGPMFYRRFVRGEPATGEFLKQAFELTLSGLAPAATKTSRSPGQRTSLVRF